MNIFYRFPINWPPHQPRAKRHIPSRFHSTNDYGDRKTLTLDDSADRLEVELERMIDDVPAAADTDSAVITSMRPEGSLRLPDDPGVAVYVNSNNIPYCFACDKFNRLPANMAAIAAHIGAVRGQLRWGVADPKTAFAGFRMLAPVAPWWVKLEFPQPPDRYDQCKVSHHQLIRAVHPDVGGTPGLAADLNAALDEAEEYYRGERDTDAIARR